MIEALNSTTEARTPTARWLFFQRQIMLFALRRPNGDDFLAHRDLANFREKVTSHVGSLKLGSGRRDVVVNCPAALQISAPARGWSTWQIVQQQAAIVWRHTLEQFHDARKVG